MLSRLFGKRPAPNPKPGPQLGMLALKNLEGIAPQVVGSAWGLLFPDLPQVAPSPAQTKGNESVLSFQVGSQAVMVATMQMPIPKGDIDFATERSWMWKTAAQEMQAQKAHAIVMCVPNGEPVQEALAVSRMICAVAAAGVPVGVYWGNGGQVHSVKLFADSVKNMSHDDMLPVMLWIGLVITGQSEHGPFTLSTLGMSHFGHKELEVIDTTMPIGELRMMVYELVNYLIRTGPVLKDGDTCGSESQRFKAEHTTSRFRKDEPVIRLHLP